MRILENIFSNENRAARLYIFISFFLFSASTHAANQVQPPPDPGFEISVKAADVIAEIEVIAGTPFRAMALVRKTLKGDAPKIIELEGFNSYNWDTIHRGFSSGSREIVFLSRTGQHDVFAPLTPASPRLTIQPEGVMLVLGDPPFRIPVKKSSLEEGIALLMESAASGKVPEKSDVYLRRLWDENEIESRYLCVAMAGALRDPRATPLISEACRVKLLKLRLTAIDTLGKIGSVEAIEILRVLLKDEKSTVAREAARVLCELRSTSTLADLLEWVRRSGTRNTDATAGKSNKTDTARAKTENLAIDILVLALDAAPLLDHLQISKALLDIARSPNDKLARGALAVLSEIAQKEEIPALIELAEDTTYEWRAQVVTVLQRITLQPLRDATAFKKWWGNMGAGFGENVRRDAVEGYARAIIKGEAKESWRIFSDLLKAAPAELALPSVAPLLLNPATEDFFSAEDLSNWKSPLTLPYHIERLGREDRDERAYAQTALARLCVHHPRMRTLLLPLLRAGLADCDDNFRRSAQVILSQLSDAKALPALFDAMEYQGGSESFDASKSIYSLTARTLGYGPAEPQTEQLAAIQRLRAWWKQASATFQSLALSVPISENQSLRIWDDLDPQQRSQRLENLMLGQDSRASGAAFSMLFKEHPASDGFWTQLADKGTLRERCFALLARLGDAGTLQMLQKQLAQASGAPAEHPLLRALSVVGLASVQDEKKSGVQSGARALLEWLRSGDFNAINLGVKIDDVKTNGATVSAKLHWHRLAVICLGLTDRDPESLRYLETLVEKGLKAKSPSPLDWTAEKPGEDIQLLRAALLALCARSDSTPLLLRILGETESSALRVICARELSLRRAHSAVPILIKIIEKTDRSEWLDLARALQPLLQFEDAPLVANLLNGANASTRSAGAFLLKARPDVGVDDKTLALLCTGLTDQSKLVRYYCAEALGVRKATFAARKLCLTLSDEDDGVRAVAAGALGLIGDETSCQLAATAVEKETHVNQLWLRALAIGGGAIQLESILKFCNAPSMYDQRVGLEALSLSKQSSAQERMLKTFHNDESAMQSVALDALSVLGDKALYAVSADLKAADAATRARIALLLSRMPKTLKVKDALKILQSDKDENIQSLAKFILERTDSHAP